MASKRNTEPNGIISEGTRDIESVREKTRQYRWLRSALTAAFFTAPLSLWLFLGAPLPHLDPILLTMIIFFSILAIAAVAPMLITNGSPHVLLTPEQIEVGFEDVAGIGPVKAEVQHILNLFLASGTFRDKMGGRASRGVLFDGAPGTGKTHMAKALAHEAGVPFLFLSATSVQSMWHGGSAKKIRSFFKALREAARKEGGAIGFIEEIDAIALKRGGMAMSAAPALASSADTVCCGGLEGLPTVNGFNPSVLNPTTEVNSIVAEGGAGTVNELLVQMQSFDEPTGSAKLVHKLVAFVNSYLPKDRRIKLKPVEPVNILLIAATNRADQLDPALLRPGRFDRKITFDLPSKQGRRELIDYFLSKKSHDADLATDEYRDALAALLSGYSPVMIENLFDGALAAAVLRGSTEMNWADIQHARMTITIGIGQPVEYTAHEERLIASHEAGHATMAWLVAQDRRLEVLTTIKRGGALGLLAHGDTEDKFTRSRSEMLSLIQVAMGGQVAEELLFDGEVSTGPASDLAYATTVAIQMVGAAGMGTSLVSLQAAGGGMMDNGLGSKVLGSARGFAEVDEILNLAKARTRQLLMENLPRVEALRDALLERQELIGTEINEVLESVGPRPDITPLKLTKTA